VNTCPRFNQNSKTIETSSPLQNPFPFGKFLFSGQLLDVKNLWSFSFAFAVICFDGGVVVLDVTFGLAVEFPVTEAEDAVRFDGGFVVLDVTFGLPVTVAKDVVIFV